MRIGWGNKHIKFSKSSSNGLTERYDRTLVDCVSKYTNRRTQDDWDLHIAGCLFAYRTSIHAGMKQSPFFLLYGRDPRQPDGVNRDEPPLVPYTDWNRVLFKDIGPTYSDAHEIALRQARASLQKAMVKQARDNLNRARQDMVTRWTAKARDNGTVQGQMVYVKRDPKVKSKKLRLQFEGPYEVLGITEFNNVRLRYAGDRSDRGRKRDEIEAPLSYVKPIRVGARNRQPTGYRVTTATNMTFELYLPDKIPESMQSLVD